MASEKAAVGTQFTPTRNFYSPELESHYCVGLDYTVKDGNGQLAELVPSWFADGRIVSSPVAASVKGG